MGRGRECTKERFVAGVLMLAPGLIFFYKFILNQKKKLISHFVLSPERLLYLVKLLSDNSDCYYQNTLCFLHKNACHKDNIVMVSPL